MAIDFPNSPTEGQIFNTAGKTWQYTNGTWVAYGTAPMAWPGRNRIINGGFDVRQRTGPWTSGYGIDQWQVLGAGTTHTVSRVPFALGNTIPGYEPTSYSSSAVVTSAGAGNFAILRHVIESVRTFAGQVVTFSFWAKADAAKSISIEFEQNFGNTGSPSATVSNIGSTKIALTTSWARYSFTTTMPSIVGKTLGTTGDDKVQINIWFDSGSTWNPRTVNLGQQSGTFDLWGVQMESGSVATPFEVKPYGDTLRDCQRYFRRTALGTNYGEGTIYGYNTTATALGTSHPHPVTMRATPSATVQGTWLLSNVTGALNVIPDASGYFAYVQSAATNHTYCSPNNTGYIDFSAEL